MAEKNTDLSIVKRQVTMATQAAQDLSIESDDDLKKASDLLSKIKTVAKMLTDRKSSFVRPAYDAYKKIMAEAKELWDPLINDCDKAESIIKGKGLEYRKVVNEKARLAEAKIAADLESGKIKKVDTAANKIAQIERVDKSVSGDKGGVMQFKKIRVVKVVDETKVPRAWLVLDMVKIRKDALAGIEIAGVEVVEEEQVAGSNF